MRRPPLSPRSADKSPRTSPRPSPKTSPRERPSPRERGLQTLAASPLGLPEASPAALPAVEPLPAAALGRERQWNILRARVRAVGAMASAGGLGHASKSLQEELEEFVVCPTAESIVYPPYLSDREKQEVRRLARGLGLRSDTSEHGVLQVWRSGDSPTPVDPLVDATDVAQLGRSLLARATGAPTPPHTTRHVSAPGQLDRRSAAGAGADGPMAPPSLKRVQSVSAAVLMEAAAAAIAEQPTPLAEGDGGVYAIGAAGKPVAVLKPLAEEKFSRNGMEAGEGGLRELAAYRLDHAMGRFSGVPPTMLAAVRVAAGDEQGSVRRGAVQQFCESVGSMEDRGMSRDLATASAMVGVEAVQRVALLDLRCFNTDRHPGNVLLVSEAGNGAPPFTLTPIDHGCVLPPWFALSEARLDWSSWPQSKEPLTEASLAHVAALDAQRDAALLRRLGLREECVTTLRLCTLFLQRATAAGLSPHEMALHYLRAGCFESPSALERIVERAAQVSGVPFRFAANSYGEQEGKVSLSAVTRRPGSKFFEAIEAELALGGSCRACGANYMGSSHECFEEYASVED